MNNYYDCKILNRIPILVDGIPESIERNIQISNIELIFDKERNIDLELSNDSIIKYKGDDFRGLLYKFPNESKTPFQSSKESISLLYPEEFFSDYRANFKIFNKTCSDVRFYHSFYEIEKHFSILRMKLFLFPNVPQDEELYMLKSVDLALIYYKKGDKFISIIDSDNSAYMLEHIGSSEVFYSIVKSIQKVKIR